MDDETRWTDARVIAYVIIMCVVSSVMIGLMCWKNAVYDEHEDAVKAGVAEYYFVPETRQVKFRYLSPKKDAEVRP